MKTKFLALLFVMSAGLVSAQDLPKFGVTGGLLNTNADIGISLIGIQLANIDAVNKTGFYLGVVADFEVTEDFHVQPEFTYGSAGDLSFLYLPVLAKFYVAQGFHIQAGPQFNYSTNLDDIKSAIQDIEGVIGTNGNLDDVLKSVALDLSLGAGYDVNEKLSVQARYSFALTDRYDGPLGGSLDIKNASLHLGLAYFF